MLNATLRCTMVLVLGCICFWAKLSSSFILSTSTKQSYRYDEHLFAKNNNRREVCEVLIKSIPLLLVSPVNAQEMAENVRKY